MAIPNTRMSVSPGNRTSCGRMINADANGTTAERASNRRSGTLENRANTIVTTPKRSVTASVRVIITASARPATTHNDARGSRCWRNPSVAATRLAAKTPRSAPVIDSTERPTIPVTVLTNGRFRSRPPVSVPSQRRLKRAFQAARCAPAPCSPGGDPG